MSRASIPPFSKIAALLLWTAGAVNAAPAELKPYRATYETNWSFGLALSGEAVRELLPAENNRWQLTLDAKASSIARQREESLISLDQQAVVPHHYHYERKVLGRKRKAELDFDWSSQQVTNQVQDDRWQMQIPAGTQDHLSYQLQLRNDLKALPDPASAADEPLTYQIADGGHLKTYTFEVLGSERLRTPLGDLDTWKVARVREPNNPRQTLIWFAPELDYLIVKLQQREKDGREYELLISDLAWLPLPTEPTAQQ